MKVWKEIPQRPERYGARVNSLEPSQSRNRKVINRHAEMCICH